MLLTGLVMAALWWYISSGRRLVHPDLSPQFVRRTHLISLVLPAYLLVLMVLVAVGIGRLVNPLLLFAFATLCFIVLGVLEWREEGDETVGAEQEPASIDQGSEGREREGRRADVAGERRPTVRFAARAELPQRLACRSIVEVEGDQRETATSDRVEQFPVGGRTVDVDPDAQTASRLLVTVLFDEARLDALYLLGVLDEIGVSAPEPALERQLDGRAAAEVEPPAAVGQDPQPPVDDPLSRHHRVGAPRLAPPKMEQQEVLVHKRVQRGPEYPAHDGVGDPDHRLRRFYPLNGGSSVVAL